jgi:hypothetical protein
MPSLIVVAEKGEEVQRMPVIYRPEILQEVEPARDLIRLHRRHFGRISVSQRIRWTVRARSPFAAVVLAGAAFAADGAGADIIKKEDALRGVTMTQAQCTAIAQAVWVNAYGQDFCVRYYLSTAGGEGSQPVVFLNGDSNGPLKLNPRSWADPSKAQDVDTSDLMAGADGLSKTVKTTAIYVARIGVEGTSGNHMSRKTVLELQLMNAALDAIKQRYGFEGFHLAGQSGGSRLVVGLLGKRRDLGCSVAGSGQMFVPGETDNAGDPGQAYYNALNGVPAIAQNRAARLLMITDRADQQVPVSLQTPFAEKMRQAGRFVPQFFVEATDPKHHGVFEYTRLVMAGCLLGKPDADIARAVGTIVRRNVEINNQHKQEEAKAKGAIGLMAGDPAIDPRPTPATTFGRRPIGPAAREPAIDPRLQPPNNFGPPPGRMARQPAIDPRLPPPNTFGRPVGPMAQQRPIDPRYSPPNTYGRPIGPAAREPGIDPRLQPQNNFGRPTNPMARQPASDPRLPPPNTFGRPVGPMAQQPPIDRRSQPPSPYGRPADFNG